MAIDQVIQNFEVYEDAKRFLGVADAKLPSLSFITASMSGAGIAGNIDTIVKGHTEAMSLSMNFRTMTEAAMGLTTPDCHQIEFRGARQDEDATSRRLIVVPVKHVLVVLPKTYDAGKFAPASTSDASGEYAVRYWAHYVNGKKILEVDPMNYICLINGVDYLADTRAALGL